MKGKKIRAFEVRRPGAFWSISTSNMCDASSRNSLFTIKNIPVFHHLNDKMTKNLQVCVLLKNDVEMHQKIAHDDLYGSGGFGGFCNQLGIRLLFQYLSCLGVSEPGNKIFHQIFNRSPILSNSCPAPCPPPEKTAMAC